MTYAQWLEQCRQQAAARQAETARRSADCDDAESETAADFAQAGPATAASQNTAESEPAKSKADKPDPTWLPSVHYFQAGRPFQIGDIAVSPFTIPHDAADPVGFVFEAEGVRMALGYRPRLYAAERESAAEDVWTCCCWNRTTISRCCATALIPGR